MHVVPEISIGEIANIVCRLLNVDAEICSDEQRLRPEKSEVNGYLETINL